MSITGITQCANFRIFLPFQILREINFGHFDLRLYDCRFDQLPKQLLNFCEILTFSLKSKFKVSKIVEMAVFDLMKSAEINFTSREI